MKHLTAHLENSGLLGGVKIASRIPSSPLNAYYGVSISQYGEPIEQFVAFLLAHRIQETHGGKFYPYIAGRNMVLNLKGIADTAGDAFEVADKLLACENRKIRLFEAAMKLFRLDGKVIGSDEVWDDALYRDCISEVWTYYGKSILMPPPFFEPKLTLADIPKRLRSPFSDKEGYWKDICGVPAARLYTLAEVAEALYFSREHGVVAKVGPVTEQPFDAFIGSFCSIIHFRQPADLETIKGNVKTLSPYVAYQKQSRIYVGETEKSVLGKLTDAEKRCVGSPVMLEDDKTGICVLNPLVQYAVYAAEAARATGNGSIRIMGNKVSSGAEVIGLAEREGVREWSADVASALWKHLINPLNCSLEIG